MSSRDRKRSDRRKRKQRSAERSPDEAEAAAADGDTSEASPMDLAAEAEARGVSKSELRNERAREALDPLPEGERPTIVTVGVVISILIGASILIAYFAGATTRVFTSGVETGAERPNPFQVFIPAALFFVMAWGMWNARYWAVLGFQAVMAIIMIGSFLALISATSVAQALGVGGILIVAGILFWLTVKALARIQMPDRHMPR